MTWRHEVGPILRPEYYVPPKRSGNRAMEPIIWLLNLTVDARSTQFRPSERGFFTGVFSSGVLVISRGAPLGH
jgi:hypothetical protein